MGGGRCRSRGGACGARGRGGSGPARACARERDEVRRWRDAELLRDVLGRRGRRSLVAGRRRGAARDHPRAGARIARDGGLAARYSRKRRGPAQRERQHRGGRAGMSWIRATLWGIWELVVGDDWATALGVAAALGATALIASASATAWWVMPVAVVSLLALSLRRASR